MENHIKLIVGLGNPGHDYELTRHNAGVWLLEALATHPWRADNKFHGLISGVDAAHLLIPTTYMNHSGRAVAAVANYYKLQPEEILIVHDELDLPCGTVRLKFDGGDGGHNGLKDIAKSLGTKKFYRLRLGIDRPKSIDNIANYVLDKPSKSERQLIDAAISQALTIMPKLLAGQISKATQELHTTQEH